MDVIDLQDQTPSARNVAKATARARDGGRRRRRRRRRMRMMRMRRMRRRRRRRRRWWRGRSEKREKPKYRFLVRNLYAAINVEEAESRGHSSWRRRRRRRRRRHDVDGDARPTLRGPYVAVTRFHE
jgi:hypothetical protein